jgi:hypothetical protein
MKNYKPKDENIKKLLTYLSKQNGKRKDKSINGESSKG